MPPIHSTEKGHAPDNDGNRGPLAKMVAVVTGGTRGIGLAIARRLAADGADLIITARGLDGGIESIARSLANEGRGTTSIRADVGDSRDRGRLLKAAWDWRDRIDIWVNNAGADVLTGTAAALSFEEKWDQLRRVDVEATVALTRAVADRMRVRGAGCVINIGWDQAETGMAGDSGELFALAKGAVMAFTRAAAKSYAPVVRVNCVAPGWIRTAWGTSAGAEWQRRAIQESLRARWGTPEDVAGACAFLASPEADFVNGEILRVNGGFSGTPPGWIASQPRDP